MNGDAITRFKAACVGAGVAMILLLVMASGTLAASSVSLCVSSKQGEAVTSGECPANKKNVTYTPVALPSEPAAQQTLISILPYIKFAQKGVDGKPTIQVTGANLQVVSGSGKTNGPVNGAGNLIIGYADKAECGIEILSGCGEPPRTGSHNLVLGTSTGYTSWGAILGGLANRATARNAFVVGQQNKATEIVASVSGGLSNTASGPQASVSGGGFNIASSFRSSVSGGLENEAAGFRGWVGGGNKNTADGTEASVAGGINNKATGPASAILGGSKNKTTELAEGSSVSGGLDNAASGERSSVSGGRENTAAQHFASVSGGYRNTASGEYSSVSGGQANTASGSFSSILGGKGNLVETEWGHFP